MRAHNGGSLYNRRRISPLPGGPPGAMRRAQAAVTAWQISHRFNSWPCGAPRAAAPAALEQTRGRAHIEAGAHCPPRTAPRLLPSASRYRRAKKSRRLCFAAPRRIAGRRSANNTARGFHRVNVCTSPQKPRGKVPRRDALVTSMIAQTKTP